MVFQKGDKVIHNTKGCVETIVDTCKVKINGEWQDGVIYITQGMKTPSFTEGMKFL